MLSRSVDVPQKVMHPPLHLLQEGGGQTPYLIGRVHLIVYPYGRQVLNGNRKTLLILSVFFADL